MKNLLYRLTAGLPCRVISRDGTPYLERYFLFRLLGVTVYLHRFVGGDGDEGLHDHPWRAFTWCLAGGYTEVVLLKLCPRMGTQTRFRRLSAGQCRPVRTHQIVSAYRNTWTLFAHGPVRRVWWFYKDAPGGVLMFQPYPIVSGQRWWKTAPRGRDVRQPL